MPQRKLVSLFLSLLIHATLFIILYLLFTQTKKERPSSGAKRVELALSKFVTQPPGMPTKSPKAPQPKPIISKPTPKLPEPTPPVPRPIKSKTIKKSQRPTMPKPMPKSKKTPSSAKKIVQSEKKPLSKPTKKRYLHKSVSKPSKSVKATTEHSALANALGAPAIPHFKRTPPPPSLNQINDAMGEKEFHALYHDEFDHFTPNQKQFIRNNLNRIQAITQHYLTIRGYPLFAAQQRIQGVNVVEFYLWPNGDITDLNVITSSGFDILDDNSVDTIETAYKDYPHPKEKTKIRFYIHYRIY